MAELTATARTGLHRYHFPQHQAGHLLLDLSHAMQDNPSTPPRLRDVELSIVDTRTLLGGRRVYQWSQGPLSLLRYAVVTPVCTCAVV